jgi:hypothetical protein
MIQAIPTHLRSRVQHRALLPLLLSGVLLWAVAGRGEEPAVEGTPAPVAPVATQTPAPPVATQTADSRAKISNPLYGTLTADHIAFDIDQRAFDAEGNAQVDSPKGRFFADTVHYNLTTQTGVLDNARGSFDPFYFKAATLTLDPGNIKRLHQAELTTCSQPHPHYALLARDAVMRADNTMEARHVSLLLGRYRLLTLPRLTRKIGEEQETQDHFPLLVGSNSLDGTYLGTNIDYPLSATSNLQLIARLGTQKTLRGDITVARQLTVPVLGRGTVSLRYTRFEDAQNRVLSLTDSEEERDVERLLLSREPSLQASFQPIALPGALRKFNVLLGASVGRFKEDPTGITSNRAQVSTVLRTPAYRLGPLQLRGEFGAQQALYSHDEHVLAVSQVTLETPPTAKRYFSISYVNRSEHGKTPFLFDRVVVPHEIYSELELPVRGSWFLGVSNRYDIENGNTRDLSIAATCKLDCLTYRLSYNKTRCCNIEYISHRYLAPFKKYQCRYNTADNRAIYCQAAFPDGEHL